MSPNKSIVALDVGEKRIGVAKAYFATKLASPLTTLENDNEFWDNLTRLCEEQSAGIIVIGLPRGLEGQATAQTKYVKDFAKKAERRLGLPVQFQDEAVTSKLAEKELITRGKPYGKGDIDALAATYILEDFLREAKVK